MSEYNIPIPKNDPIRSYYSESAERKKLITQINELKNQFQRLIKKETYWRQKEITFNKIH